MARSEISGIPEGLRQLVAKERDKDTLLTIAKFLKANRNHLVLAWLTEQLLRRESDPRLWQLHSQALVELGFLSAAEEVLDGLQGNIKSDANAQIAVDLIALRGRIAKQRLVEASEDDPRRNDLLARALKFYHKAFKRAGSDPSLRYFPGINIVSLQAMAQRVGLEDPFAGSRDAMLKKVHTDLETVAGKESSLHWWQATRAEIALAEGDYPRFAEMVMALVTGGKSAENIAREEQTLKDVRNKGYVEAQRTIDPNNADAFVLNSFHRQLMELWDGDDIKNPQFASTLMGLRQALLQRRGGSLEFDAATLRIIDSYAQHAVLGDDSPMPYDWLLTGIGKAKAVAAILVNSGFGQWKCKGTGFLIRVEDTDTPYLLTNKHVLDSVNVDQVRVRFEAVDTQRLIKIKRLVWQAPLHDAALIELDKLPEGTVTLAYRAELPPLVHPPQRVPRLYAIGHTDGAQLHVSMQDNELLDHEGGSDLVAGSPVLVHYRTPTRTGNSGCPVFDEARWELIALHRGSISRGGGAETTLSGHRHYSHANEGVSIASIAQPLFAAHGLRLGLVDG